MRPTNVLQPTAGRARIADSSSTNASQVFIGPHNEPLSVIAVRVCNKDRSPARIHGCDAAPTPTGFAEIVDDDIPNTSSYVERGSFP
jgi:hypothetical protein